jgi:hypothetical protein
LMHRSLCMENSRRCRLAGGPGGCPVARMVDALRAEGLS